MALWRSPKPVVAQVHGFCVGGGTDFALCSDLIVCAEDCRIGYPPARVWGSPTTAMWFYRLGLERTKRLLLTGDALDGRRAVEWGLASEAVPADELDEAALALARRMALLPGNQLQMMKLLVNQSVEPMGLAHPAHRHAVRRGRPPHPGGVDFRAVRSTTSAPPWPSATARSATTAGPPTVAVPARLIGVVLAGGAGRRIGGDKARPQLEGRPLLHYPLAVLRAVARRRGRRGQAVDRILPGARCRGRDLAGGRRAPPSAGGHRQALRCAEGRPVVVVAGDMPFVTRGLVGALARERSRGGPRWSRARPAA